MGIVRTSLFTLAIISISLLYKGIGRSVPALYMVGLGLLVAAIAILMLGYFVHGTQVASISTRRYRSIAIGLTLGLLQTANYFGLQIVPIGWFGLVGNSVAAIVLTVVGYILFAESLTPVQMVGMLITAVGLALITGRGS